MSEKLKEKFGEKIEGILGENPQMADLDEETKVILVDETPIFFKYKDQFIPVLLAANSLPLKRITVDMGAVSHIVNGADVMKPGIVKVDEGITQGDIVGIEDEKNHKLIAVGEALEGRGTLKSGGGKAVKNLHYVGDKLWDMSKEI